MSDQETYIRATVVMLLGTLVLPASLPSLALTYTATSVCWAVLTSVEMHPLGRLEGCLYTLASPDPTYQISPYGGA